MDYWDVQPQKVRVGGADEWRISWRDGRKGRSAAFKLQRDALAFRTALAILNGKDPRLIPSSRWVCDGELTFAAPGRSTALTAADLELMRAQGPHGRFDDVSLVRLVVFGMRSGVETITLDGAVERVAKGELLILLTALDDIPTEFLTEWARNQPPAKSRTRYDGTPEHPYVKIHQEHDTADIDPIIAEGYLAEPDFGWFSPPTLRMIAIARGTWDLRHLPASLGELRGYLDWSVVSAAVLTDLDVTMFMQDDQNGAIGQSRYAYRVTGLPFGPLADLQVYGSNLDGRWQGMSHTLGCQHRGHDRQDRFTEDDQMLPLQEYAQTSPEHRCSKCGGRWVRRPTVSQLAYYRDMEALAGILQSVRTVGRGSSTRTSHSFNEEERAAHIATLNRIDDTWCRNPYLHDHERLATLVDEARAEIGKISSRPDARSGSADVLRFPGTPE